MNPNNSVSHLGAPIFLPLITAPDTNRNHQKTNTKTQEKNNETNRRNKEKKTEKKATHKNNKDKQQHEEQTTTTEKKERTKKWHIQRSKLIMKRIKQKRSRTNNYDQGKPRPTTIADKTGQKTLKIASINPDNLTSQNKQNDLLHELQRRKIHIALIQETHIPHDIEIARNGYKIITSAAIPDSLKPEQQKIGQQGMYQGGVAIIIHADMQQHIHQITRINHRILKITLKSQRPSIPITLITSYAPHKGYKHEIRNLHWETLEQVISEIPHNQLCIWGADANGQLGNRKKTKPELNKIIGMNTMVENTEKGNGKALQKYVHNAT